MKDELKLEFIGYHWEWSGDLFTLSHPDGRQARVYVDSVGETWVEIRRIPEGGYFHTEKVDAFRAYNGAEYAANGLAEQGFTGKRTAPGAHRVREQGF